VGHRRRMARSVGGVASLQKAPLVERGSVGTNSNDQNYTSQPCPKKEPQTTQWCSTIDQGGRKRRGNRSYTSTARKMRIASAPFQPIAAGERAEYTRIEYGSSRVWTELVSQLAAFEVVDIRLERRVLIVGHARRKSKKFMSGANGSNPAAERGSM
jgi:hypothetical protein